jgi:uncharacterized repeat protein (TIGR01451 family)
MRRFEPNNRTAGGRRRLLRAIGSLTLVCAALFAPALAHADTRTATVTLSNPLVTPSPQLQGGFGVYNFTISGVSAPAAFPFVAGTKQGHCVELTQEAGTSTVTLRTAPNFTGTVATSPGQVMWLLESSRANSPLNATQAAAHQSAIWQVTNPNTPAAQLDDPAGKALAAQLVAQANANAANATKQAALDVVGGAGNPSCAGTTRTITVSGTPFTTATLTITSGVGTFVSTGTTTTTVAIGANGTGTAVLQSNVNNPGVITVSADIVVSTMVQSDGGGKQDFAYLQDQHVTKTVSLTFTDCRLSVSKTANPSFKRTFTWTVKKTVTSPVSVTANGGTTANWTYQVVATKSQPVDSGWTVSGSIAITNTGPATSATVNDSIPGATCVVGTGGTTDTTTVSAAASGETDVPYVCTYAAAPTYNTALTNTAKITWTVPSGSPVTVTATAPFTFADGTAGNPSITGDSADIVDTFNGGAPVDLGTVNASTTFNTSSSYVIPTTQTGCADLPNTATLTSNGTTTTSTAMVTECTTPVTPAKVPEAKKAGGPTKTTMTISKTASVPVVKPGNSVRFSIRWKNTGKATAKNVVVCDTLPSGMTFASAPGAAFKSGKACWTRKAVGVGKSLAFIVIAKVDADQGAKTFTNVANATASNAKSVRAQAPVRSLPQKKVRPGGVTG